MKYEQFKHVMERRFFDHPADLEDCLDYITQTMQNIHRRGLWVGMFLGVLVTIAAALLFQ